MGIGMAKGDDGARAAAEAAIKSPLLEASIEGARGVLFNITGGAAAVRCLTLPKPPTLLPKRLTPEANIIFGAVIDETLKDEIRVTVIATGFNKEMPTHGGKPSIVRPGGGYQQQHDNDSNNNKPHMGGSGIIHKHSSDTEIPPWIRG